MKKIAAVFTAVLIASLVACGGSGGKYGDVKDFIKENDFIIASPGVDLTQHKEFGNKFLCELDFFSVFFTGIERICCHSNRLSGFSY